MGGLSPETRETVLPRGVAGLGEGSGEGEGFLLSEPERATIYKEAGRQEALGVAQATARGEARAAAREEVARALGERNEKTSALKDFLRSLEEHVTRGPEQPQEAGKSEVVWRLSRLEENGGPRPTELFQKAWTFSPEEALALGDPNFEGRTLEWAKEAGKFGKYRWRILGWVNGENTLDTSYTVSVEPPPGYIPPVDPRRPDPDPAPPPAPADPLAQVRSSLQIVGELQKAIGGGGSSAAAESVARLAGEMDGRRKAEDEARARMREMEDRHRKELEDREAAAYKRGLEEGDRKARWELEDKIRELQWKLRQEEGPDMIDKIVGLAGGPEGVSGLISAVVGALNRKPAAGARPGAPPPPPRARLAPSPGAAKVPQAPAPAASSAGREPSRAEHVEAMAKLGEALSLLEEFEEENPGADASIPQAIDLLHQAQEAGMADGPLASWWAAWESNLGPMVDHILKTAEEPVMDLNGLKALLIQRLDEGASDEAIIAEARSVLSPEQQAEWLPMLKAMPKVFLGRLLGVPHHQERLAQLVDGLTA